MTSMQRRTWMLAAAGKFFEGYVVFVTGVALPLIAREFNIGPTENGLISAASLCGILIGAVGLGSLSDRFGRKSMIIVEMIIFTAFETTGVNLDRIGEVASDPEPGRSAVA
jgi:putative MFS transporter